LGGLVRAKAAVNRTHSKRFAQAQAVGNVGNRLMEVAEWRELKF
jgi:hypothetical protein